ncbi:MAG: phosphotransferase [Chloroflexi bacterium]|nr:phosphotransferase [Chloroflexota bacterium]
MNHVLSAYGISPECYDIRSFGSGHINKTFLLMPYAANGGGGLVLQHINTNVFRRPDVIARNLRMTADYLARTALEYYFLRPLPTLDGDDMFVVDDDYWRLLPYAADTVTVDQAESPKQAYEAARQFGRFARLTHGIDLAQFEPTIPDFHNLTLRWRQYENALAQALPDRCAQANELIAGFGSRIDVVTRYEETVRLLPVRLMHHDTKINNALLRMGTFEGVCICDLDTLMAGYIISDLGDMVRTYVCPVSEEEPDVRLVAVREDYFEALVQGYLIEVRDVLTAEEKNSLFYAGEFMIYMQGIRFLTDYLNGDVYYPVKHAGHNLDRARNQWVLLQRLTEKKSALQRVIDSCL